MAVFDIDRLMAHLAQVSAGAASTPAPPLRDVPRRPAKLDDNIRHIGAQDHQPVPVGAWIDGIQHQHVLAMVRHRPIIGQYTSAVALGPDLTSLCTRTAVRVVCSEADAGWLSDGVDSEHLVTVADGDETAIAAAATALIDTTRRALERTVSHEVVHMTDDLVVVDGPLTGHPPLPGVAGVVKTHPCAYLNPEAHLQTLQVGQATDPPFEILAEDGSPTGRYGSYLRLHDHTRTGVLHGLIRVETHDPALNLPLATTCLNHRQWSARQDPRWSVHLQPIAFAERVARTRIPASWQ